MKIDKVIERFLYLIRCYWNELEEITKEDITGSLKDDWLQVNWELIVEGSLRQYGKIYLEVYGDGADVNSPSSRVIEPTLLSTHVICCYPKKGIYLKDYLTQLMIQVPDRGFNLDKFVSMGKNNWYYEGQPFDKFLVYQGKQEFVFDISDVDFVLQEVSGTSY